MKSLVQAIPTLLSHSDKNVREETKQMAIEIYKWIRDAIKPQLQNIKPVQVFITFSRLLNACPCNTSPFKSDHQPLKYFFKHGLLKHDTIKHDSFSFHISHILPQSEFSPSFYR